MSYEVKGSDVAIAQEHEDQLQLGLKVITSAFASKMNSLEQEIRGMKMTCDEQRSNVAGLQKRNSALEAELVDGHQRTQQLAEENKELFKTVNSLRKQISRLEHLKQAVLSSIQDDQAQEAEFGDTRILMSDEFLRGATPLTSADMGYGHQQTLGNSRSSASLAAPAPAPAIEAAAPASPVVDGKQFFRQARSRLSYEAFNAFLASIKSLNNGQATREETLDQARRIFGHELADLYKDFENLLNRHGM